jgi:hypothetical protein
MYEPNNNQEDKIKEIQESLYSKNPDGIFVKRRHVLQNKQDAKSANAWNNIQEEKVESNFQLPYVKIFFGALVFFVLALIFVFSKFFLGTNVVSGNKIDILVSGPVSVAGGEELPLNIQIKNNNSADLKAVDLLVEYPDGTKSAVDQSVDMKRYSETIGDISVGKSENRLIKSVLFGEENSQKTIKITVEYKISGSNSVFSKEKDFNVLIGSSPINISVSNPTEVNTNQPTDFSIKVTSNSVNIVKNLVLKIEYPFGFNFLSSDPSAINSDNSVFDLGDLAPGATRIIKVTGNLQGQDGEQRAFKFNVGTKNASDNTVIDTLLASYMSTISLKKSSVGLSVSINQDTSDNIAIDANSKNTVGLYWKNNLTESLNNLSIEVKLAGKTLNEESITVDNGYYDSSNNTIIFDKSSNPDFDTIGSSAEGNLGFDFSTLLPSANPSVSFGNSSITFDITVSGYRSGSPQEVFYSGTKTVKVSSNLNLLSRGFRTYGPFENSGPFPPKVNNETTYTIIWTASDSFNDIKNAKVSAILPVGVTWTGYTDPTKENITYDKNSSQVVWNIGDMESGIGVNKSPRKVSFQVSITPSISQYGYLIGLVNEATISGTDAYTGAQLVETKPAVTTDVTSDPEYVEGIGSVVK